MASTPVWTYGQQQVTELLSKGIRPWRSDDGTDPFRPYRDLQVVEGRPVLPEAMIPVNSRFYEVEALARMTALVVGKGVAQEGLSPPWMYPYFIRSDRKPMRVDTQEKTAVVSQIPTSHGMAPKAKAPTNTSSVVVFQGGSLVPTEAAYPYAIRLQRNVGMEETYRIVFGKEPTKDETRAFFLNVAMFNLYMSRIADEVRTENGEVVTAPVRKTVLAGDAMLYQYVETKDGRLIAQAGISQPVETSLLVVDWWGETVGSMARKAIKANDRIQDAWAAVQELMAEVDERFVRTKLRTLAMREEPIMHGDCKYDNVLAGPSERRRNYALIDWERGAVYRRRGQTNLYSRSLYSDMHGGTPVFDPFYDAAYLQWSVRGLVFKELLQRWPGRWDALDGAATWMPFLDRGIYYQVFDRNSRNWIFGREGTEGSALLQLAPGETKAFRLHEYDSMRRVQMDGSADDDIFGTKDAYAPLHPNAASLYASSNAEGPYRLFLEKDGRYKAGK